MTCPKCGTILDDHDGFGCLAHGKCGYCSHPSTLDGFCGICGVFVDGDPKACALMKGDIVLYNGGRHEVLDTVTDQFVKLDVNGKRWWTNRRYAQFLKRPSVHDKFRAMRP